MRLVRRGQSSRGSGEAVNPAFFAGTAGARAVGGDWMVLRDGM
jgi:hypothetical protein